MASLDRNRNPVDLLRILVEAHKVAETDGELIEVTVSINTVNQMISRDRARQRD